MRGSLAFAFSVLALILAACGSGSTTPPPTPTVATVSITAPAGNNLKIGEAVQFSAVAKDDKGTELTGKTFTWASSDNNLASVAADGKVTAKRFGKVKITATVDGKTGESAEQTTYGLEVVGGTTYRAFNPTYITVAALIRFRPVGSSQPVPDNTPISVNVVGPSGWIGNAPQKADFGFFANTPTWWDFGDGAALSGNYSASAVLGGVAYTTTFSVDVGQTAPTPTNLAVSAVSATSVRGTWTAPAGAALYRMTVNNRDTGAQMTATGGSSRVLSADTQATFSNLNLPPTAVYYLNLQAANFDFRNTDMNAPAPAAFNLSRARQEFTLLQMAGGAQGTNNMLFTLRSARPDGTPLNANANITVNGPAGWNGGQPLNVTNRFINRITDWLVLSWFGPAAPPLTGNYSYSVVVGPTTYSGTFSVDATQTLPDPASMSVTAASPSSVTCTWAAVPGAGSYNFEIWNETDSRVEGAGQIVTGTSATTGGLNLTAGKTYYCQVAVFNADVTAPFTTPLPSQSNGSFRRTQITLP